MKKILLLVVLLFINIFVFVSCGQEESVAEEDSNIEDSEKNDVPLDAKGILTSYAESLNNIMNKDFKMYVSQETEPKKSAFRTEIKGESGLISWELENNDSSLIVINYDAEKNEVIFKSFSVGLDIVYTVKKGDKIFIPIFIPEA